MKLFTGRGALSGAGSGTGTDRANSSHNVTQTMRGPLHGAASSAAIESLDTLWRMRSSLRKKRRRCMAVPPFSHGDKSERHAIAARTLRQLPSLCIDCNRTTRNERKCFSLETDKQNMTNADCLRVKSACRKRATSLSPREALRLAEPFTASFVRALPICYTRLGHSLRAL